LETQCRKIDEAGGPHAKQMEDVQTQLRPTVEAQRGGVVKLSQIDGTLASVKIDRRPSIPPMCNCWKISSDRSQHRLRPPKQSRRRNGQVTSA